MEYPPIPKGIHEGALCLHVPPKGPQRPAYVRTISLCGRYAKISYGRNSKQVQHCYVRELRPKA